jgi:predicted alpha/beta hydrolase family esterase
MKKHIIFFHGGGSEEDFEADSKLVDSLKSRLGSSYLIHYPFLPNDGTPDLGRREQIRREISESADDVILIAHSFGASMLLACLSETKITKKISGIFLISTPFWNGTEDWVKPFMLKSGFQKRLNDKIPTFFYHCRDDEEVPFAQLNAYREKISWATFREIPAGGHQLNNDLTIVSNDIKSL